MSADYEFEKYIAAADTVKRTIATYGVAIIPGVLNDEECSAMQNGMWSTLEHWTRDWDVPIRKSHPASWKNLGDLLPLHSMLIQHHGLGHAQFIWDVRQNPAVVAIFARIWRCAPEDLLVSFDAASFHMPSEVTKKGWRTYPKFHSDQSFMRPSFECIQSWVTAFDVNDGDATLAFLEGSNKYHAEFAEAFPGRITKEDWHKLEDDELEFYRSKGCEEKYVRCPKGSIVLWDSRTIHCGVQPQKGRTERNFRCVVYLCYMPRGAADEGSLKKKRKAFEEQRMTTHWPCRVKLFPKMPRTYGAEIKPVRELPPPVLGELGTRLAGF